MQKICTQTTTTTTTKAAEANASSGGGNRTKEETASLDKKVNRDRDIEKGDKEEGGEDDSNIPKKQDDKTPKKEEKKKKEKDNEKAKNEEKKEEKKDNDKKGDTKSLQLNHLPHSNKEHVTLVLIGHVDSGKSTTAGQILLSTGELDQRTLEKYKKEAKERGRDGWGFAYRTDEDEEEKARGNTIDCARVSFETQNKRFTLVDAPGHNNYVPNMISGAALADVAILIVSARSGEFEAGFKRNGQTREHSLLVYTLGVSRVIVAVNKMDHCNWKQERFELIKKEISSFLKAIGFKEQMLDFLPVASYAGQNIKEPLAPEVCSWYKGECLLGLLDKMDKIERWPDKPLAISVLQRYKGDYGLTAIAKVESGVVSVGDTVVALPCNQTGTISNLFIENALVSHAIAGENILACFHARSKVILENLTDGSVICHPRTSFVHVARKFRAEVLLLELPNILTIGYSAMLHIHNLAVECQVIAIPHKIDPKTREKSKIPPVFLRKRESAIIDIEIKSDSIPFTVCVYYCTSLNEILNCCFVVNAIELFFAFKKLSFNRHLSKNLNFSKKQGKSKLSNSYLKNILFWLYFYSKFVIITKNNIAIHQHFEKRLNFSFESIFHISKQNKCFFYKKCNFHQFSHKFSKKI
ncbi:eukaryotic polypeptide chain release factor 3 [Reticulomyxa filosa]|uniref:Eukaryotic polypeptide chain release factor 3 n=1 Tax=Reticulomyxa filosa TaxID=46433 RepID=X6NKS3_RETFI|nr:eukaryotic polypeptide chain release factor 3 [Reticulomyxa filosa]|eukprot:ETO26880.1 eukaryotic polypeptide chain release factor 3 [Reticulomyxa filosa]